MANLMKVSPPCDADGATSFRWSVTQTMLATRGLPAPHVQHRDRLTIGKAGAPRPEQNCIFNLLWHRRRWSGVSEKHKVVDYAFAGRPMPKKKQKKNLSVGVSR